MDSSLKLFFPTVFTEETEARDENIYCKFDSHLLQLFMSSLFLTALVAFFFASAVTRLFGLKISMLFGGYVFLVGAILYGAAMNVSILIIGRILLGVGVGFANQSVPVYLSETTPAKHRVALNIGFRMAITIEILAANLISYGIAKIEAGWGWKISLALVPVPAIMITVGSFLPDTSKSILKKGHAKKVKDMLKKIHGIDNVNEEVEDLIDASKAAKRVEHPWKSIMLPRYRPQLIICTLIPFFQQITGVNVIMFYAPVLFKTLGLGDYVSLMFVGIIGIVYVFATIVSINYVKFGRRFLFLEGGMQMIICQILVGILIGINFGNYGVGKLSKGTRDFILFLICINVSTFTWSWGLLGWLVPSEICPLEIRSAGQAISVSVNMFFTFVIGQFFFTMLCHMKYGLFLFFAALVIIKTIFVSFLLPETKNVPIEEMNRVWKAHWFWGKYIPDDAVIGGELLREKTA